MKDISAGANLVQLDGKTYEVNPTTNEVWVVDWRERPTARGVVSVRIRTVVKPRRARDVLVAAGLVAPAPEGVKMHAEPRTGQRRSKLAQTPEG